MGKRKLAQLLDSEDENEEGPAVSKGDQVEAEEGVGGEEKDVKEGEEAMVAVNVAVGSAGVNEEEKEKEKEVEKEEGNVGDGEEEEEEEEEPASEPKPLGDIIKRSGRGKLEKLYYQAFELDGNRYELEDSVLITPEEKNQKPYVAIIKEIKQSKDGSIAITGQWFYRPEEAFKKGGGSWCSSDSRELFYSFHQDEVAAETVMHKCVVHFIPPHKQTPVRSKHPGFIVRKVYDTVDKKLWKLTDKDYKDSKQLELDMLVQKTKDALGELPDIDPEEIAVVDQEETDKSKSQFRRRTVLPININKEENTSGELSVKEFPGRPDTPGSCLAQSEEYKTLVNFNVLTGNKARDRWMEKIFTGVKYVCKVNSENAEKTVANDETLSADTLHTVAEESIGTLTNHGSNNMPQASQINADLIWPDDAVAAVMGLEKVAFDTLGSDMHKYNLKMRQLEFNLKNSTVLAQRLLKKELDASKVLNMSPAELKDGMTAEEKSAQEPEEIETMQMADVRCTICGEKKVGVTDIIHVGHGDRYQLECLKCGNTWYSSRDSISSLTIQTVHPNLTVGTAPWATSKFEEVERELTSPRDTKRIEAIESGAATSEQHGDIGKHSIPESQI